MELNISELKFLMTSLTAKMPNFDFDSRNIIFDCQPPFLSITSEKNTSSLGEIPKKVKSNRGRKKKIQTVSKKFKSNISFVIKINNKDDKIYNIRIFNKGKIICVGVLDEDKKDFLYCIEEVKKYLATYKVNQYKKYKFPELVYEALNEEFLKKYEITEISSTLENYQFSIGCYINLYKLKEFFISSGEQLINVDFSKLYEYYANCCIYNTYLYNSEDLVKNLEQKGCIKKEFVMRDKLIEAIKNFDLRVINLNFIEIWNKIISGKKMEFTINMKYFYLKQYIIYRFSEIKKKIIILDYQLVESVIFKENINTLMISKKKDNRSINLRIFGPGTINIQGSNSRELANNIYIDLCRIFEENKDRFCYNPEIPPMINFMDKFIKN